MGLTLSDARATVLDHLDDDNTRWSNTQVDRALAMGLSQSVFDYVGGGGDRFQVVATITTDVNGAYAMTTENPSRLTGVAVIISNRYFPLEAKTPEQLNLKDNVVRQVQIRYTPTFVFPTNTSHPLVGSGSTAALSWEGFDHWVCARAALFCSIKDAESRPEIQSLEMKLAQSVMTMCRKPTATLFPQQNRLYSNLLAWTWLPDTRTFQMLRRF